MSKHTPGTWGHWIGNKGHAITGPAAAHAMIATGAIDRATHLGEDARPAFIITSSVSKAVGIALADTTDEAVANAYLIAAAPDLLAALQLIASTDPVDAALDPQRASRIASEAIAKATGSAQ